MDSERVRTDAGQRIRDAISANPFLTTVHASPPEPRATVVIALYNAVDDAAECIISVARHTLLPFRLVLINDGSSDSRVSTFLRELDGASSQLVLVDRANNRGFAGTVNEGLALAAAGDVVLLNADTVVSARWLEKLIAVSRSRPNVATVTPLTNNGTICSVPNVLIENEIPDGYDVDSFGGLIEVASLEIFPEAPTGVGFCMLITRRALEEVGEFDVEAFGTGYGEENDFCQRAIRAGFVNLIADNTFVYHKGRASFGDRAPNLVARHLETISTRYPRYASDVASFYRHHPLKPFHAYLNRLIEARCGASEPIHTRVLHVLHRGGGTEKHARDVAHIEDETVLSYLLLSDGRQLDIAEYFRGRHLRSFRFPLPAEAGRRGLQHDAGYRQALGTICWALQVDVIHVHHLMHNSLDIATVAADRRVPYLVTLHDYYLICPMYTLLGPDDQPCGACIGNVPGKSVDACMSQIGLPASYLPEHQRSAESFLQGAAKIVAPNVKVREIFGARFPDLEGAIEVIEHGHRRPGRTVHRPVSYDGRGPLHVAVIGGLTRHKGSAVLRHLMRANRSDSIVFHLYGTSSDPELLGHLHDLRILDGSLFAYHGRYDADEIATILRTDGIHLGLQPAIWPEAFSYTLSEFVEAGIPVIAGDLGAQGERVRRFRLGWTVSDIREPRETLDILESILQRPALLAEAAAAMRQDEALPALAAAWRTFRDIYRDVSAAATHPMEDGTSQSEANSRRGYVAYLAMTLAERTGADPAARPSLGVLQADLAAMQERLQSPRHRIADAIANAIQRIPIVWPILAWVTDRVLEREKTRRT